MSLSGQNFEDDVEDEYHDSENDIHDVEDKSPPENMEEWEDKWWLTKHHKNNLEETTDIGYVCIIYIHENHHDASEINIKHFKTISMAYDYVCDYIADMYKHFGGRDINLFSINKYANYRTYEKSLSDWRDVYFLLNYGSSSGATPYTITVSPISFE